MKSPAEVALEIVKEWRSGMIGRSTAAGLLKLIPDCFYHNVLEILGPEPKPAGPAVN